MLETLLQLDFELFRWINQDMQHTFLDSIMPWWRSKYTWIPFYIILIAFLIIKYKVKGFYFILALSLTVGVVDMISSKVVKTSVQRLRPCKTPAIKKDVHLLINCGSGYSFTSSHAANHFALAFFLLFTFCKRFKFLRLPLVLWAGTVALAQVYVGVHFPFDVIAGAFLGIFFGYFFSWIYKKFELISIEDFVKNRENLSILN